MNSAAAATASPTLAASAVSNAVAALRINPQRPASDSAAPAPTPPHNPDYKLNELPCDWNKCDCSEDCPFNGPGDRACDCKTEEWSKRKIKRYMRQCHCLRAEACECTNTDSSIEKFGWITVCKIEDCSKFIFFNPSLSEEEAEEGTYFCYEHTVTHYVEDYELVVMNSADRVEAQWDIEKFLDDRIIFDSAEFNKENPPGTFGHDDYN